MHRGPPIQYIAILAGIVEEYGCSSKKLLTGTRLTVADLESFNGYVSQTDYPVLIKNAYQLTGARALGIELGARLNISSHVNLGHAIMNCATFGDAMAFFLKYYRIMNPHMLVTDAIHKKSRHITIDPIPPIQVPGYFNYEAYFAALYTSARFLLQMQSLPFRLQLAYKAPEHEKDYYRFFGESVQFNCLQNSISFPVSLGKTSISTANASLLKIYEQQCKDMLDTLEHQLSVADRIVQILNDAKGKYPTLEEAASLAALSPRTLRRRLEAENTGFQEILDSVRKNKAIDMLTHTSMSLASIAYTLGFNDISNFRRAFTKWTGRAPLEFRQE